MSSVRPLALITLCLSVLLSMLPATGQSVPPSTPRQDLPSCYPDWPPEPIDVRYTSVGASEQFSFAAVGDDVDLRVEMDFGDGNADVRQVTDNDPVLFNHAYQQTGQFRASLALRGTVNGTECAAESALLRSVVVTEQPVDNLCIEHIGSEQEHVFQIGSEIYIRFSGLAEGDDLTVTVEWPERTETRLVGPGTFEVTYSYAHPGLYRPVMSIEGVDGQGPCSNPATIRATFVIERRLFGPSRTETAVAVSQALYGDADAAGVVLARQDTFPDALTGATAATAVDGPVLLTDPGSLHPATEAELRRVLPAGHTVFLLGGTAALSDAVAQRLTALGYQLQRIAGSGREQTAEQIARELVSNPQVILLATGGTFPDALLAGAAAARVGGAVLLTGPSGLAPGGQSYLAEHPGVPVVAVGQEAANVTQADEVVAGQDHYETAVLLAERFQPAALGAGLASGESFPDGLTAGPYLAEADHALLLTQADRLPATTAGWLEANGPMELMIFGGTAAISVNASGPAREATGNY